MKNIILIAPPAAGKGTLAKMLCDIGYISLSTGDVLREKAKTDKSLALLLSSGKLVSDEIVFKALDEYLTNIGDKPYILDGFPRTINQALMYDEYLKSKKKDIGVVIYLNVDYNELEKRVTSRVVCPKCKRSYSLINKDLLPKNDGLCDDCGNTLVQREDDTCETFKIRYNEYMEKTYSLIDYYKSKNILYEINSTLAFDTYKEVCDIVK